jgi:vitamin B12 transporter
MSLKEEAMNHQIIFAALALGGAEPDVDETIVVTGSLQPVGIDESAVSATIIERKTIHALGLPMGVDVLRLVPGVSISSSGPRGTHSQVRIRGGETSHSLLFVDGIRFNDPAADNYARFELLANDALSRIEVVRGPQSALWGSEALGGVVAIETADPLRAQGFSALAEYGSLDSARTSAQFATRRGNLGLSGSVGWLRSEGIDSFSKSGERDGFENKSVSLRAGYQLSSSVELGIAGHWIAGTSEFDSYDPLSFKLADTLDSTKNRIFATRGWARASSGAWAGKVEASYLDSANRNRLDGDPLNSTFGKRLALGGQVSRSFGGHQLTAAIDRQEEEFSARDQLYFGATDQQRSRSVTALVGEWRARWTDRFSTDVALRHDRFSRFKDATTLRASALLRPAAAWTFHAGYGEGIAQPTFYELYGFFQGFFVGNPDLRPEHSRGWEVGARWRRGGLSLGLTGFKSRLSDEIVDVFDPSTFLSSSANAVGRSRRRGVEAETSYAQGSFNLGFNYTFLDAEEQKVAGAALVREIRRPRHSANLFATGSIGRFDLGGSLAYVGSRTDVDFELTPAQTVKLHDYLLASLKIGWRVTEAVEAYVRGENLFDADYQDTVHYNTPGRTIYAGLRFRPGD